MWRYTYNYIEVAGMQKNWLHSVAQYKSTAWYCVYLFEVSYNSRKLSVVQFFKKFLMKELTGKMHRISKNNENIIFITRKITIILYRHTLYSRKTVQKLSTCSYTVRPCSTCQLTISVPCNMAPCIVRERREQLCMLDV